VSEGVAPDLTPDWVRPQPRFVGLDWSLAMSDDKPTSSTIADLCKRHGFGVAFSYKMMAKGAGPRTVKIGRVRRVLDTDEREWLDQLRAEANGGAK
jgi:predicted DNA-binding transcriptional regulator AlpA